MEDREQIRHGPGTDACEVVRFTVGVPRRATIRQVYALAHALCAKVDERFPVTFAEMSVLLERLRYETGHPEPRLEDVPRRPPQPRWRRRLERELHDEVLDELLGVRRRGGGPKTATPRRPRP